MGVLFKTATADEMMVLGAAVDALTREDPRLIFESVAWCSIVHSFNGERGHRVSVDQLIERNHGRGESCLCRLDPPGCGCTDCLVGNSKPINEASERELLDARAGVLANASCRRVKIAVTVGYE